MIAAALPVATGINRDKGMLIYSADGITLRRVSVKNFMGDVSYGNLFSNDVEFLPFWNEDVEFAREVTFVEGFGISSAS